ncbi:MAG TPA: hypothetical protein VMG34_11820 [Bacteroidota bacterium]|nr:hypothetical protein [Bacteroidota bacterium]
MVGKEEYLPERPTPVKFTLKDRKLILGLRTLESTLANRIRLARIGRGRIVVSLSGYDMAELMCQVELAAGREKDPEKRRDLKKLRRKFPLLFDLQSFFTATDTDYGISDDD